MSRSAGYMEAADVMYKSLAAPDVDKSGLLQITVPPWSPQRAGTAGPAVYPVRPAAPARTLCDILRAAVATHPTAMAIDDGLVALDYTALVAEVDSLGERLREAGIGAGDRVGVRAPSGTADLYISILAVLAVGAAYVPVDADDPDERAELVWSEAGVCAVLGAGRHLAPRAEVPPRGELRPPDLDDDAWIIFTSGSTGTPKGVAVTHRSAAAFVDAEARMFLQDRPIGPGDRVLAGLSVAFDASCEEMWLAWRHGACLAPAPRALVRSGADLGPWLVERGVTVVSTVPTLAALWPAETLERVRLVILGGEACPAELADRLADADREVWNTYGPTEATVVACAAQMFGDDVVRIGLPLDGWRLAVVDPQGRPVRWGETGELVIGGVGLGRYLDADKDAEKYAALPELGWSRGYRTGDLVRAERRGLVFVGRADDQVKIGGRRVELGELDAALLSLPGVAAAATAVRCSASGTPVLVGYVVPEDDVALDVGRVRRLLGERLPAALVPRIAVVATLPTRTSGKVDRDALPWPLPAEAAVGGEGQSGPAAELTDTESWLARKWTDLLAVPAGAECDFFDLGGTSLAAAQLVSVLRRRYPEVSVADVYHRPTLRALASRLDELEGGVTAARRVRPTSRWSGVAQTLLQAALFTLAGTRWLFGLLVLFNIIELVDPLPWTVQTSWWLLVPVWLVLFSPPGRWLIVCVGVRLLCHGIRPGSYRRGGPTHLRLWTAERLAVVFSAASFTGTPLAGLYARALGCRVGRNVQLHSLPPVTGMATFGDGCAVESEVDLAGWWLDGDVLHIGEMSVGAGARVGGRSTVMPGADIGERAEVLPGSMVSGLIPAEECWAGSPARCVGTAGESWPSPRTGRSLRWSLAYMLSGSVTGLFMLLASIPSLALLYFLIRGDQALDTVLGHLAVAAPLMTVMSLVLYTCLLAVTIRVVGRGLVAGCHPADGGVAWRAWLTERLMGGARATLFPLYASLFTPVWLRMLGAKVGRHVEASTVLTLPRLITVGDGGFLADDTLLAPYELRGGWLRLGRADVGERAFVGNSGIVGPDRAVPEGALVGVLSDAPADTDPGSSWLGRPAIRLPRVVEPVDPSRTFAPPKRLVLARSSVEVLRVVPMLLSVLLSQLVLVTLALLVNTYGIGTAAALGGVVLFAAGVVAALVTTAAKWVLVGRFRRGEHPLWSSFVWRNELFDNFVEVLAVPWLVTASLGTPTLNAWLRTLGAKIGRGVWCETHWLPETDLVRLGDGATVNRGTVLQTHLFHDRLMRLDRVDLEDGATLGPRSIMLPGTRVEPMTTIGPASLVMRGETVPTATRWCGNPISAWRADSDNLGGE
ncbi:Pls/PosA family non-ribosomal peptide synthetase [Allokutzneria oryzae]|uniref:Pls/PosA family non-ribosomal peptide synthetase n=1 Tax=Allokutzneria oryzae TaxID=1378989 RepID=A0ABV5ZQE9_9PSEU